MTAGHTTDFEIYGYTIHREFKYNNRWVELPTKKLYRYKWSAEEAKGQMDKNNPKDKHIVYPLYINAKHKQG